MNPCEVKHDALQPCKNLYVYRSVGPGICPRTSWQTAANPSALSSILRTTKIFFIKPKTNKSENVSQRKERRRRRRRRRKAGFLTAFIDIY